MKLLLICQYYPPEIGAAANRASAFSRLWSASGHEVEVITGLPNHPDGILKPGYRCGPHDEDGVKVIRSWLLPAAAGTFLRRTVGQLSFMVTAVMAALRFAGRPDAIVVSSPGFFSIFSGFVLRRLWRRPLVLDIRDLWPGFARSYGMVRPTWILVPFEWLERWAYRHADLILTVTDGCADQIEEAGAVRAVVRVIPNGADVDLFDRADLSEIDLRAELGVPTDRLVGYVGNHGRVHGIETLVEAAAQLQDAHLHFVMVGDGPVKRTAIARSAALGIRNISWLDPMERVRVPGVLRQFDLCVSTQADIPALGAAVPAKLFDYFLARRPVVASAIGEQRDRIEAMGGLVCQPGSPEDLAEAIDKALAMSDIDVERSRDLVVKEYGRARLAEIAAAEIGKVVTRHG